MVLSNQQLPRRLLRPGRRLPVAQHDIGQLQRRPGRERELRLRAHVYRHLGSRRHLGAHQVLVTRQRAHGDSAGDGAGHRDHECDDWCYRREYRRHLDRW